MTRLDAPTIEKLIIEGNAMMDAASDTRLTDEAIANKIVAIALANAAMIVGQGATVEQVFACVLAARTAFLLGRESNGLG